ncbi:hypothetical protein PV729_45695 [Streptomyces europaeiscabiei]|uniref:DUF1963 domain-containing protein n=1 Tax=Streptomyces europaeiscabiei TaxID=146819 RepID=A0ABU4NTU6_9ACTN|nr:hypothetical protein [Streptomyces europaeiscabiei]MDX3548306.1 hypothetical protein [Streptomyces europaeiscabiei]MDX3558866.1 hypothetical protein [Streptomyces europaeiscabiei]MDX3705809.1 hypothetical protein [Streptomyces europaeiscabiei]
MTRTTPPRPLDVEALFPELAAFRGTTTRLHPRPGRPDHSASSVGGPMLWPADEPWPVCGEAHSRGRGRRPADIRRYRQVLASAWAREQAPGPTDEERELLGELHQEHRIPGASEIDPLPMIGLAQLYRRDVPDLPAGPGDCDLLQVFWCPFNAHGPGRYDLELHLRWRRSWEVGEVLTAPPQPLVVGSDGFVPEPCVLHPEQVVTYPFAGLLPEELCARIDAWEEALDEEAEQSADESTTELLGYQYDLSIPPGWHVGGFASWHSTDPYPMDCLTCTAPMHLLLTIDSSEWDGGSGSWKPLENQNQPTHRCATPTEITVGRWGELNVFACPNEPGHPHRWSIQ